jgi:transposase-like protein/5-methylcytosine-specific restriction endonuclease McrA
MFVRKPRFTEEEAREAIAAADCWTEALRLLGMRQAGGNHGTLKRAAARWNISTDHFDPNAVRARRSRARSRPLEEVLVPGSTYPRGKLKARLYDAGLKKRECEECGQGELWHGKRIALILDHINGDATDHRLENLRIACANCAATFDTHCGRNRDRVPLARDCTECGKEFAPKYGQQRFCTISCAKRNHGRVYTPQPAIRRVERPPYEQLIRELEETNYSAVGRKYGVSDNAVRKWIRWYERELAQEEELSKQPFTRAWWRRNPIHVHTDSWIEFAQPAT